VVWEGSLPEPVQLSIFLDDCIEGGEARLQARSCLKVRRMKATMGKLQNAFEVARAQKMYSVN